MRWLLPIVALSCAEPFPGPLHPPSSSVNPAQPAVQTVAPGRTLSLSSASIYVRSKGEEPALYVVSDRGTVRRYTDADAIVLSPPRLVRFAGAQAHLRDRLNGEETLHPDPVLAPHLTVDPSGRLWFSDAAGRLVDLVGQAHPTQPPVPLMGAKTNSENVSLLAGFDASGELCIATRCAPDHCSPPIETVHVDGARVWGRTEWRLGPRRMCHGPTGWKDEIVRPNVPRQCIGCEASHVLGPRNGWIVWRTHFGSMPRYMGEGGASSARVGAEDPIESGPEDGVQRHAWPVAISPDGRTTLVCRERFSDTPWPHPSRCGVVSTAALDVGSQSAAPQGLSTRARSTQAGSAPTLVPAPDLDDVGFLTDVVALP